MAQQTLDTTGNEHQDITLAKIQAMLTELYATVADHETRIEVLEP